MARKCGDNSAENCRLAEKTCLHKIGCNDSQLKCSSRGVAWLAGRLSGYEACSNICISVQWPTEKRSEKASQSCSPARKLFESARLAVLAACGWLQRMASEALKTLQLAES